MLCWAMGCLALLELAAAVPCKAPMLTRWRIQPFGGIGARCAATAVRGASAELRLRKTDQITVPTTQKFAP